MESCAAWKAAQQDRSSSSIGTLAQKLQAVGVALSSIAVRSICNNPFCMNVDGSTEQSIVSGKAHKCSRCRTAYYCSSRCQRLSWPQHKPVCKVLVAAGRGSAG
jgi:hypothetical protein